MIFFRAFFVWTTTWLVIGTATTIYGSIVWGNVPVGRAGTWFLSATILVQPALCGLGLLVHWVWPHVQEIREWVMYG